MKGNDNKKTLKDVIRRRLNVLMIILTVSVSVVSLFVQMYLQRRHSFDMIRAYLNDYLEELDVAAYIHTSFDAWMDVIDGEESEGKEAFFDNERLEKIVKVNHLFLSEISVVDENGFVTYSSNPDLIGFHMTDSSHTTPFLCLLEEEDRYSDQLYPSPFDGSLDMIYIGRAFRDKNGFMLFGVSQDAYRQFRYNTIYDIIHDTKIGITGYLIHCDLDKKIVCVTHTMQDEVGDVFEEEDLLPDQEGEIRESISVLYGEKSYVAAQKEHDFYLIGVYPIKEADQFELQNIIMVMILYVLILSTVFAVLFLLLRKVVIEAVERTHFCLKQISDGDLEQKVDAGGSKEFVDLSNGINGTVDKLKQLIEDEKDRIRSEMENAKSIQTSIVPTTFPKYQDQEPFGLYASMDTAEAVGGDFYDFFMRDEKTLVIVMADVSGKGMPAALYMMRAKTLIRTFAEQGLRVEEVAVRANQELCEDNTAAMFVTAWIGFLDLDTGVLSFVHAGHTYPVLVREKTTDQGTSEDEVFFIEKEIDMVLGGIEEIDYTRQEITLQHGDSIYLYTDGVTEAMDIADHTYDEKRLLQLIREKAGELKGNDKNDYCKAACQMVYDDVKKFAAGAMQHDDITMMWVKY